MFVNNDGYIKLKKPFPKRMSWKRALEFSIQKWEFILSEVESGELVRCCGRGNTCALCYKHDLMDEENGYSCEGCPVAKKTGWGNCADTPYHTVKYTNPETIQAEIDFLKSL